MILKAGPTLRDHALAAILFLLASQVIHISSLASSEALKFFCEGRVLQAVALKDENPPVIDCDPAFRLPSLQRAVYISACPTGHRTKIGLGYEGTNLQDFPAVVGYAFT